MQQIFWRGVCVFIHTIDRHYSLGIGKIVFSSIFEVDYWMKFFLLILYVFSFDGKTIKSEMFSQFVVDMWKDFVDLSSHLLLIFSVLLDIFRQNLLILDIFCVSAPKKRKIVGKVDYEVREQ